MNIKERLEQAKTRRELLVIGRAIHKSTDPSLRPSLQDMINERKVVLWSSQHRRARQNHERTLRRLRR